MLRLTCPHCSRTFAATESQAGGVCPCPLCGKDVTIPASPAGAAPNAPRPVTAGYPPAALRTSSLAIAAMVCGLIVCIPPVSLAGLVMGIVALSQIGDARRRLTGRGLAIVGIVAGAIGCAIAPVALLIAILLPALGKARSAAEAAMCQSNLKQIGVAGLLYANDYNQAYPRPYSRAGGGDTDDITFMFHFVKRHNQQYGGPDDPGLLTPYVNNDTTVFQCPAYWTTRVENVTSGRRDKLPDDIEQMG